MDPVQPQASSENAVTVVILDSTYTFTAHNVTRIPSYVVQCYIFSEACIETGPHRPQQMISCHTLSMAGAEDDTMWEMPKEEEGPRLPEELPI